MDQLLDGILDAQLLTDVFGRWPSFHDAEIKRLAIDASLTLEIDVKHWSTLSEVDERGYFKIDKRCLTTLRFGGVVLDKFEHFEHQNVLGDLMIYDAQSSPLKENLKSWYWPQLVDNAKYHVELEAICGCGGDFLCQTIQVAHVTRLD